MIFAPLNDNIIAEPERAKAETASGILLASVSNREQPRTATVLAVGPKVTIVKPGDRFLFQAFAAAELKVGDDDYIAIREEFVVATISKQNTPKGAKSE